MKLVQCQDVDVGTSIALSQTPLAHLPLRLTKRAVELSVFVDDTLSALRSLRQLHSTPSKA